MPNAPLVLRASGLGKQYGPTWVLRDVNLDLRPGQVMALLGENGAGKSTLVKILSGAVTPDTGTVEIGGVPLQMGRPDVARHAGMAIVYQELSVCPDMTVEDNVMLGSEYARFGWLRRAAQRQRCREVLASLGHSELELNRRVGDLSVGAQQLVEIARALVRDAKILVLDEPTSSLAQADVERLFTVMRGLRERGIAIVYISHFLEEIRRICDSYCVLRDGQVAGCGELEGAEEREIVRLMVGRDVDDLFPQVEHQVGATQMQWVRLHGESFPRGIDLEVQKGEILGIAGLVGSGRTETLRLTFGLDTAREGEIRLDGQVLRGGPRARIAAGLGFLSEDRKGEGLAQGMSIRDNLTLSDLRPFQFGGGFLRENHRKAAVDRWIREVAIKVPHQDAPVAALSGGNQQKVAFARLLHQNAEVFLLDEPTRGIDVGTKAEIYRWMGRLAAEGKTVIFVSSYFRELLELCDRIALLARGRLIAVRPARAWSEASLMHAAMGGSEQDES